MRQKRMAFDHLSQQMLGQYELRELLGVGGMGAVYRAYQASLKREVAVKVLPSALASQAGYAERFIREAETAAALEHPHIVPIVDYGTVRGTSYIVMRLLTGGTIASRLAARPDQPPSLGEIAEILKDLASALDYAHGLGVIHRDLKPTNVMFDNQGNAYLVDFGIAKLLGGMGPTKTGMTMGTPSYMAPEQWRNEELGPAADQYALGVMTYQLVTGRVPFEATTPYALMHKHLHEMPTPAQALRTDVPEAVTTVLQRVLSKDPQDRFRTVTAYVQAFEGAISGKEGVSANFSTFRLLASPSKARAIASQPSPELKSTATASTINLLKRNPLIAVVIGFIILLVSMMIVLLGQGSSSSDLVVAAQTIQAFADSQTAIAQASRPPVLIVYDTETPTATVTEVPELRPTDLPEPSATPEPVLLVLDTETPSPTATEPATATPTNTETPTSTATNTLTPTATDTPSATATATSSPEPSETPTADVVALAQTLAVQQTAQAFIEQVTGTAIARDATATATLWTSTPSLTPTSTNTQTEIPTNTSTATTVPTATPDPASLLEQLALTPVRRGTTWIPVEREFYGIKMMLVPAGCFLMGSNEGGDDERPVHEQCFDEPFWIGKTEVTNAEYGSTGCREYSREPSQPRNCVSWFDARAFCEAAGMRLPSEAEWEYAARGPDNRIYPWGDTAASQNAVNLDNSGDQTVYVGSLPGGASWVGALDMSGNLWEWTSSLYEPYPYAANDGRESDTGDRTDVLRVLRGGAFNNSMSRLRAANRDRSGLVGEYFIHGFRCVRDFDSGSAFAVPDVSLSTAVPNVSAGSQSSVRVIVDNANLRSGPDTNYERVATATRDALFTVIARTATDDWYLIQRENGAQAWISASIVELNYGSEGIVVAATIPATPPPAANQGIAATPWYERREGFLTQSDYLVIPAGCSIAVHSAPASGVIVYTISPGDRIWYQKGSGTWIANDWWWKVGNAPGAGGSMQGWINQRESGCAQTT